jgi:hypothetical protein
LSRPRTAPRQQGNVARAKVSVNEATRPESGQQRWIEG